MQVDTARIPFDDPRFVYQADFDRVIDGDTLEATLDLGVRIESDQDLRLVGIDTAEVYGVTDANDDVGQTHATHTRDWLVKARQDHDGHYPLMVRTLEDGKFGRWLALVWRKSDGACLQASLLETFGPTVVGAPTTDCPHKPADWADGRCRWCGKPLGGDT